MQPSNVVEMIEEAGKEPTLDEYLDRDPASLTEEDRVNLIKVLRSDRTRFHAAEEKRKDKKAGIVSPDEEVEDGESEDTDTTSA